MVRGWLGRSALILVSVLLAGATPAPRVIAAASYPEGPLWSHGKLWFTEYGGHRVATWDGSQTREVWKEPAQGPAGLAEAPNGDLWVTCYDTNSLVRLDGRGHLVNRVTADDLGKPLEGPNDLTVDAAGGVYFTTSGRFELAAPVAGRVFYMAPDGRPHEVASGLHYANGIALTDGGHGLLVSETLAHRIVHFDVGRDGSLTNRQPFADLTACVAPRDRLDPLWGPDGLRVDYRGKVYAAVYGASRVQVFGKDGTAGDALKLPVPFVTNIALTPDGRKAYVTASRDTNHPPYPGAVYELLLEPTQ